MPTIGNNLRTLLQGLSDFWVRFYADYEELEALYQGTEVLLAQTYLDLLSSFLNISVVETPIFNTELFKLITMREDQLRFVEGDTLAADRYVIDLPSNIVEAPILQNKVIEPTASLEPDAGYEIDSEDYQFKFAEDPAGRTLRPLGETLTGNILTYGLGILGRFYVDVDGTTPFAKAKTGHWLRILNSSAGNNNTFRIAQVLDAYTLLLQGTFTLPETNNGSLQGTLFDSEFVALEGFAQRAVTTACGGTFDDATRRATSTMASWYANAPLGLGIRKGDLLRVFDGAALPSVPQDFTIGVVRHDKLYLHTDTPAPKETLSILDYVILRDPFNGDVIEEGHTFAQVNQDKSGILGSVVWDVGEDAAVFSIEASSPPADKFASTDKQRYITINAGGPITWTASLASDGTLTRTGGTALNPLARAMVKAKVKITGSTHGQDGIYSISELEDAEVCKLSGTTFVPETVTAALSWLEGSLLVGITNQGTYRIKKRISDLKVLLEMPLTANDTLNGIMTYAVHDGYQVQLAHTHVLPTSVIVYAGVSNEYTGGVRQVEQSTDFRVDTRYGKLIQVGRFMGTWGTTVDVNTDYSWLREIVSAGLTGTLEGTTTEVRLNEIAMWAPDAKVDKYHLYQTYGYLLNRFKPSSETYREFIRGVFQLYILGPTLERIESALNVIGGLPVIRDDGEVFVEYESTLDPDWVYIRTRRLDTSLAEYAFPRGTLIREDITTWVDGDPDITFESFEPLTTMFQVTDYVQDPTWWESIVIPEELLPSESVLRRTTVPALYENDIGAPDDPHIGDPGLFIGADDEGNIPSNIALFSAKRRRFANVIMNTFLKYHMFYVHLDPTVFQNFSGQFIADLRELVLIAKPSYTYVYIEPTSSFFDRLVMLEDDVQIGVSLTIDTEEVLVGEQTLTLQTLSWNIGDNWRFNPYVPTEILSVTAPPSYHQLAYPNVLACHINGPAKLKEWIDYRIDYKLGRIYPLVTWPVGSYTAGYSSVTITTEASKDPALGDTAFVVGGPDPCLVRVRREIRTDGVVINDGVAAYFEAPSAQFVAALHEGQYFIFHACVGGITGRFRIRRVITATRVLLDDPSVPAATSVQWSFPSEEPSDGAITPGPLFKSPSGMFRSAHRNAYIRIMDSTAGNDGVHRIAEVYSMYEVLLAGTLNTETTIHWRLEGDPEHMDLVERPIQITVTAA